MGHRRCYLYGLAFGAGGLLPIAHHLRFILGLPVEFTARRDVPTTSIWLGTHNVGLAVMGNTAALLTEPTSVDLPALVDLSVEYFVE